MGFGEATRPPPFMMDAGLTEDQQDKVFAILHAAAPALRDREKAAHKAREALHQFIRSSSFSDGTAASLAQAQGAAEAQLALLRTKMEHDVYAVLTPEQQSKIANREKEGDVHGRGMPAGGGMPPPR
jgi:Spy/CpxP family protein refolding chaperone